jgi:hypothetical protein
MGAVGEAVEDRNLETWAMSSRPSAMCALTSARSFFISAVRMPWVTRLLFPIGAPRRDREIFFFSTFNSPDLPLTT